MHSLHFHNTTSLVERQNNITLLGITNFLESGALLRHRDQWILIEGPFTSARDANSGEITVFFPDFYDLGSSQMVKGVNQYCLSTQDLREKCEAYLAQRSVENQPPLAKSPWIEPSADDFKVALQGIQNRIEKGEILKAVPVVFARSAQTVTANERALMLLKLLEAPSSLYVYGFWQKGQGVLGATPEVLFDYSKGTLNTMALAGTCPKDEALARNSLLDDPKEMNEHQLVLEDLKKTLQPLGVIHTKGPYIAELPTLYHLKTDIQVQCRQQPDFWVLLEQLHPTPALGVAPRSAGYKWLAQFPGQDGRRGFGAPFAFLGAEEALCLVSIRNLQWTPTESMIGSGCGVVADSEFEREWRELFQKRQSVRKILGLKL